jgi:prolyl oligopeptidase family protein
MRIGEVFDKSAKALWMTFDGPGQQAALFEQGIPFRPDWEAVLTPVVDALVERKDVDATRIAVIGVSQAGYWVPRALAFEHRFAAGVADPGVVDVSTSWTEHLPKSMRKELEDGEREKFDRNSGSRARRRRRRPGPTYGRWGRRCRCSRPRPAV